MSESDFFGNKPKEPTNQPPSITGASWERETIEKLLLADVAERRAARRWKIIKSLIWICLFGAFIWSMTNGVSQIKDGIANPAGGIPRSLGSHTAVVNIQGEIANGADASAEYIIPAMRQALEDKSTKALMLLINSPGGSPVQAGMINDEITRLRKLHNKPIYAVVEETCASAAYYIAAATDEIYVNKASIVGSIGVLMNGFGFTGTMEKLGIERRLLTAGDNKGFLDPFSPMTESQQEFAKKMLGDIHQQFIKVVKDGRGDRLKETPETFSGLFWTGDEAIKLGLADGLGSTDYVAREIVKAEKIVDYTAKDNLAERFAKKFGAAAGEAGIKALQSQNSALELN